MAWWLASATIDIRVTAVWRRGCRVVTRTWNCVATWSVFTQSGATATFTTINALLMEPPAAITRYLQFSLVSVHYHYETIDMQTLSICVCLSQHYELQMLLLNYCIIIPARRFVYTSYAYRWSLGICARQVKTWSYPRTSTVGFGPRSFPIAGPLAWNSLLSEMKTTSLTLGQFSTRLKTEMYLCSYYASAQPS